MNESLNAPPAYADTSDRLWIVLSHLSVLLGVGILLPLIVYLVKKDESPAVAYHSREALNFHISLVIYALVCIPLVFIVIGIPLLVLLGLGTTILSIVAAVRASDGVEYRYPLCIRLV